MTEVTETHHEEFKSDVVKSMHGVFVVAHWLCVKKGLAVTVQPPKLAERHKDWKGSVDKGDIRCVNEQGQEFIVEAKHSSRNFTCAADWPFKEFIVCAKHAHDGKPEKPVAYIILSQDEQYLAIVRVANTEKDWFVKNLPDNRRPGYTQDFYLCAPVLVDFSHVNDEVKES